MSAYAGSGVRVPVRVSVCAKGKYWACLCLGGLLQGPVVGGKF